jgi:type II secretory pathway component GspD/PulD (secretin)
VAVRQVLIEARIVEATDTFSKQRRGKRWAITIRRVAAAKFLGGNSRALIGGGLNSHGC